MLQGQLWARWLARAEKSYEVEWGGLGRIS